MRVLVCGGRDFGDLPERYNQEFHCREADRDHPDWDKKYKEYYFIKGFLDGFCLAKGLVTPEDKRDIYGNYMPENIIIINVAAKGVDSVADEWAVVNWVPSIQFPADWTKYGKKAGYIRNKQMLDEGKPDLVIAFPGGHGTANMVKLAKEAGVEVVEVKYEKPV
jgi:hypothetical protein